LPEKALACTSPAAVRLAPINKIAPTRMTRDREIVFRHACKLGLEGIVSKRKDSPYRSGRSPDWLKMKNAAHPAVKREEEEDWGR
jgi:ATP-dependent DNA ligase